MKMIKITRTIATLLVSTILLCSCEKDNNSQNESISTKNKSIIINYGAYDKTVSEVDIYDENDKTIKNNSYSAANNGLDIGSNIQSVYIYNETMYCMSNAGDKIDILDLNTLKTKANAIKDDIVKPRYFAENNGKGYISCWADADWDVMAESYIAVIDLSTNKLDKKIPLAGGPEGIIAKNNKLYVCMAFRKQLAIIDIATVTIKYIELPAVSQHITFVDNNLIVSIVNSYSKPANTDSIGLAIINPESESLERIVNISGIGTDGYFTTDKDANTIYVLGNEAYPGTNAYVYKLDAKNLQSPSDAFISGENFSGISYNTKTDKLYVLKSPSLDDNGVLEIYNYDGTLYDSQITGIGPKSVIFN
jgi:hypothetical protein